MVYLTACAGVPRVQYRVADTVEAEQAADHYDLYERSATSGPSQSVEVSRQSFQRAMSVLAQDIEPPTRPAETARWLMQGGLETSLLAEVEHGKVARLTPQEEGSPLEAETAAVVARKYGEWCAREYEAGDCLGLFADGPTLQREDLRTLALAMSLGNVLRDTRRALRGMVSPQAVLALILWTSAFYLALWLLPEPTSKLLAAGITVAMLVWLPAQTLWSLMDGWALLVHEEAHLMERRFRGQWVERALREQFRQLRWSKTGVDAFDPATGLHYEVLTGTRSNMELHGRRMAEEFFRLITF